LHCWCPYTLNAKTRFVNYFEPNKVDYKKPKFVFLYESLYAMAIEKFIYLWSLGWLLQEYNFQMGSGFQVWKFHLKIIPWEEKPCLPRAYGSWETFFFPWANFLRWRNFYTWNSAHSEILYFSYFYVKIILLVRTLQSKNFQFWISFAHENMKRNKLKSRML
jgi:hypothetical protein